MNDESIAQRQLRESEERLQLALEATGDGLFVYEFKTGKVEGNPRLFQMLGYGVDELSHFDDWKKITHPDDLSRGEAEILNHIKARTPMYRAELRLRTKSGGWLWVLDRGRVVERDGKGRAVRMTGLHTDITERKQLELQVQLSSRLAAIGTLAAGLAHELNTPLTTLTYGLEVVGRALPEGEPAAAEAFALVKDATLRMSEIVRDVRVLSHAEDSAVRERTDVAEVLRRALRLTRHALCARATLSEDIGELPTVLANASRLGEVFTNLLINASQALRAGEHSANRIEVSAQTDERGFAVVTVRDNGEGIPADIAPRIFDPFFTTKPVGEGMGLGLAICQRIVSEVGGTLSFESTVGKGATFKVELPAASAPLLSAKRKRVLVVDDHRGVGTSLQLLFREAHEISVCTEAAAALAKLLSTERFDVVLCDLMMPGMNGMELFLAVQEKKPDVARQFVFMSGGAQQQQLRTFLATTTNRVLEKPVPPAVLSGLLDSLR